MEHSYFSKTGEWTCPKCGEKSTGIKCPQCRFCIYAGFWFRVLASSVDKIIITGCAYLFLFIRTYSLTGYIVVTLLGFLFYRFYHIGCVALWGQTPGKMAAQIKIVKLDGAPASLWNAFLRNSVETGLVTIVLVLELIAVSRVSPSTYAAADLDTRKSLIEVLMPQWIFWIPLANNAFVLSEFVVLFLNKKKRALHDFIAGTVIVHDTKLPILPWKIELIQTPEQP